MTSKQKNEILALLAATRNDLMGANENLKALSTLLRGVKDTAGAERVESLNRTIMAAKNCELDEIISSYAGLLDDLRAQAARILRKSLDLNDTKLQ